MNTITPDPLLQYAVSAPANLTASGDCLVGTLQWKPVANASGYEILWGENGKPVSPAKVPHPAFQCQPLDAGVIYSARVRSVYGNGQVSTWTPPVTFKADFTRMAMIKKQCGVPGGFVEDFNSNTPTPGYMGDFDPMKWNFAVGRYTVTDKSGFFTTCQKHAHLSLLNAITDRGQVIARPRTALLDLADNGTRTIFIDMDSHPDPRNPFYLDLVPEDAPVRDMTSRSSIHSDPDGQKGDIPGLVRISQSSNRIAVFVADDTPSAQLWLKGSILLDQFNKTGIVLNPFVNIRRPWKFTVSPTLFEAFVWDWAKSVYVKVLSTPITLAAKRYRTFLTPFNYNGPKNGQSRWLWHFDNFAFDAPAGAKDAPPTYDYRTREENGAEFGKNHVITIPDDVFGGNWTHRLFFTVAPAGANPVPKYNYPDKNLVTVNGQSFPVGVPDDSQRSRAIDPPAGLLVKGDNRIDFSSVNQFTPIAAINVHIEVSGGILTSYSDHCDIYACPAEAMEDIPNGADVQIADINGVPVYAWQSKYSNLPWLNRPPMTQADGSPFPGNLKVTVKAGNPYTGLTANGHASEYDKVQLMVDGTTSRIPTGTKPQTGVQLDADGVIGEVDLSRTPAGSVLGGMYTFSLKMDDGVHYLFARALSPNGWSSVPGYFEGFGRIGQYYAIPILVKN